MLSLVTKSLLDLESIVKGEVIINSSENTFIDDNPEIFEKDTYRTSPFGRHFEGIYSEICAKVLKEKQLTSNKNLCYYPQILEYIFIICH